jgi:hypothetical protein
LSFPEHIQQDYRDTKLMKTLGTPAGQVPRLEQK